MLECWHKYPDYRPTFVTLRQTFDAMLSKQSNFNEHYIDLAVAKQDGCCQPLEPSTSRYSRVNSIFVEVEPNNNVREPIELTTNFPSNLYVESPTHEAENSTSSRRPLHLTLPNNHRSHSNSPHTSPVNNMATTPGGVSLPPGRVNVTETSFYSRSACDNQDFFNGGDFPVRSYSVSGDKNSLLSVNNN